MIAQPPLSPETPEERIAEFADAVRQAPEQRDRLVALLSERIPLYQGRSANQTIRMRGYVLAAFEDAGLPDEALPFVLEELESGRDAYLVAGAAKAVRGMANPSRQVAAFLLKAVENIKYMDDALTFEHYKPQWPLPNHTTALGEIFRTFGWLGEHARSVLPNLETMFADAGAEFSNAARAELQTAIEAIRSDEGNGGGGGCCGSSALHGVVASPAPAWRSGSIPEVELEDQDGRTLSYEDVFGGKPSIVVFFYTRCNNPNKCSLTITKLARLQKAISEQGLDGRLRTAAITYDPSFDVPARLRLYGRDRGVTFNDDHRILRTRIGFAQLQERFQLGVNFTGSTVNRHRIELFIVDATGEIVVTFSRLQWDVREVLDRAKALLTSSPSFTVTPARSP
jgi:protein SCO1/2